MKKTQTRSTNRDSSDPNKRKALGREIELLRGKNRNLEDRLSGLEQTQAVNQALFEITNALNTTPDLSRLCGRIHRALDRIVPIPLFSISLHSRGSQALVLHCPNDSQNDAPQTPLTDTQAKPLITEAAQSGGFLLLNRANLHRRLLSDECTADDLPAIWIGIPLQVRGEVIGVMVIQSFSDPHPYSEPKIELLQLISSHIALAVEHKRSDNILRESEARLTMALEATSEGIWDWDIEPDMVYFDPRMYAACGYRQDAFPNTFEYWRKIIHPDDLENVRQNIVAHLKGQTSAFVAEFRLRTQTEDWIWVVSRGKVVRQSPDGRALRMVGTFTDITAQKKAIQALEESEQRFRMLQEASMGGIGIHEKGVILDANQALARLTGYRYEELIGMNGLLLIEESCREMVMEKILSGYDRPYDAVGVRKDGSTYPLEIQGKNMPYHGREVRVTEFRDITERKKFEQALTESEERYRVLSGVTLEGIIFHENAIAIDINDSFANQFDYGPGEIIGRNYVEMLVAPDDRQRVYQNIAARAQKPLEISMVKKDGSTIPVEMEARSVEYKDKHVRVVSVRDISERKRNEDQILQLQKMEAIGTLAGGVAHDFNNLLGGILGNVSLLKRKTSPDNPSYPKIVTIEKIVHRGANLARQLLGFAREGKYQVVPISVNSLVRETLEMFGRTSKRHRIQTRLEENLWTVEGDRTQLEQVLLNLLINAADAMPSGGNITIKTGNKLISQTISPKYGVSAGNYILISIQDTGAGMDREILSKVFDPFFTTKDPGKGTGLGLSSAYGIIQNHHGHIDAYSEPGQGTLFRILLPSSQKDVDDIRPARDHTLKTGSGLILLVDDEYDIRTTGEEMLRMMGYEVMTAQNGGHALEIFSAMPDAVDLVILDMVMPVMGGGEAYNRMIQIKPGVKVILSSGYSAENEAAEILSRGCNGFIQKPFDMIELSQAVRQALDACLDPGSRHRIKHSNTEEK